MVAINAIDAAGLQVGRLHAAQRTQWRHGDRRRLRSGERPLLYSWVRRCARIVLPRVGAIR
jgi:hypothetical protein